MVVGKLFDTGWRERYNNVYYARCQKTTPNANRLIAAVRRSTDAAIGVLATSMLDWGDLHCNDFRNASI